MRLFRMVIFLAGVFSSTQLVQAAPVFGGDGVFNESRAYMVAGRGVYRAPVYRPPAPVRRPPPVPRKLPPVKQLPKQNLKNLNLANKPSLKSRMKSSTSLSSGVVKPKINTRLTGMAKVAPQTKLTKPNLNTRIQQKAKLPALSLKSTKGLKPASKQLTKATASVKASMAKYRALLSKGKLSKVSKNKTVSNVGKKFTKVTKTFPGKGPGQSRSEMEFVKNSTGKVIRSRKFSFDRSNKYQHMKNARGGPEGRKPNENK